MTKKEILEKLAAGEFRVDRASELLEKLESQKLASIAQFAIKGILTDLSEQKISIEKASELLGEVQQQERPRSLYCKVSEKGGLSVYGLQRMPVTLYVEQWGRLLEFADTLKQFMKDNDDKLKRKGQ